jgi:hypothetical protein
MGEPSEALSSWVRKLITVPPKVAIQEEKGKFRRSVNEQHTSRLAFELKLGYFY